MKIQVLGPGCTNCERVYENTVEAVRQSGLAEEITIEKVKDIESFIKMGVLTTPALVVDGKVVSVGRVLDTGAILDLIKRIGSQGG